MRDGFYPGYRFPIEIIRHSVWLYHRFCLSFRDIEDMLAYRSVVVSHETIRTWCSDFGPNFADEIRKRRPRPGSIWHLDKCYVKINGKNFYMWRAVEQDGIELDILVTERRDKKAAKRFFKQLLRNCKYQPKVVVTDKLKSYSAALPEVIPEAIHIADKSANNRSESSHRHVRKREFHLQKFKSIEHAQRFMENYCIIRSRFNPRRHLLKADVYREYRENQFRDWTEISLLPFSDMAA
jgi:putative transposase